MTVHPLFAQAASSGMSDKVGALLGKAKELALTRGTDLGLKLLGAVVLWIVGNMIANAMIRLIRKGMVKNKVDETLIRYLGSTLSVVAKILIGIAVLSIFGVETTTFAGVLAAAGIAIGMAWSGLLSNFAAGVFMIVLRPIHSGDYVVAGGVEGTVDEIGLFVTTIDSPDNVRHIVGNSKIFSDTIKNFSTNPYRRVELKCQLHHSVDHDAAIKAIRAKVLKIANIEKDPAPDFEILDFNLAGPVLAVRPFCHTSHYWQVYFDTNRAIREACGEAGFPTPETHHFHTQKQAA